MWTIMQSKNDKVTEKLLSHKTYPVSHMDERNQARQEAKGRVLQHLPFKSIKKKNIYIFIQVELSEKKQDKLLRKPKGLGGS